MSENLIDTVQPLPKNIVEGLIFSAMTEILGAQDATEAVQHFHGRTLDDLHQACGSLYGVASGCGLVMRIGRAFFRQLVLSGEEVSPLYNPQFRFQGLSKKAPLGLTMLAKMLGDLPGESVQVSTAADGYHWQVDGCAEAQETAPELPGCAFQMGVLQEFMSWIGSGRMYLVEQLAMTTGARATCTICINTSAVE